MTAVNSASTPAWQDIALRMQEYRDNSISRIQPAIPDVPPEQGQSSNVTAIPRGLLTQAEISITETLPEVLVASLASGSLTSEEVTKAFLRRAGLAQRLANCVTEVMPETALARARHLDQYLAEHHKPIGPLHGLPVSVKEHISMQGLTCTCANVAWHDQVAEVDAHTLQLLLRAGAVFYVRTTEPQLLMHLETDSNLYGDTVNPYNRQLTSGGSSGGEGALIALRGSCLGIGTDIGGSIRNPAALCGLWGFRPTAFRIPAGGAKVPMMGYDSIIGVMGPMSTSFEGLQLFMKVLIDQKPWIVEPSLIPLPWTYPTTESRLIKADGQKRLKIAFLWHDGIVRPHPPVTRCLGELYHRLQSISDIKLTKWEPFDHARAWRFISSLYFPDGGAEERETAAHAGEPLRPLSKFILDEQENVKMQTIPELWKLNDERDRYRAEHAQHWNNTSLTDGDDEMVDVIIAPAAPGAAPPLNHSRYWHYTAQWNAVDYPALVFPYGNVSQELDTLTEHDLAYQPLNEKDAENWTLWTERKGAEGYAEAPIGLQIIGRRFEDEKVFEAMHLIKHAIGQ